MENEDTPRKLSGSTCGGLFLILIASALVLSKFTWLALLLVGLATGLLIYDYNFERKTREDALFGLGLAFFACVPFCLWAIAKGYIDNRNSDRFQSYIAAHYCIQTGERVTGWSKGGATTADGAKTLPQLKKQNIFVQVPAIA